MTTKMYHASHFLQRLWKQGLQLNWTNTVWWALNAVASFHRSWIRFSYLLTKNWSDQGSTVEDHIFSHSLDDGGWWQWGVLGEGGGMDMTYRSSSLKFTSTELCCYTKISSSSASDHLPFTDLRQLGDLVVLHQNSGWAKFEATFHRNQRLILLKNLNSLHSLVPVLQEILSILQLFLPVMSQ